MSIFGNHLAYLIGVVVGAESLLLHVVQQVQGQPPVALCVFIGEGIQMDARVDGPTVITWSST